MRSESDQPGCGIDPDPSERFAYVPVAEKLRIVEILLATLSEVRARWVALRPAPADPSDR